MAFDSPARADMIAIVAKAADAFARACADKIVGMNVPELVTMRICFMGRMG